MIQKTILLIFGLIFLVSYFLYLSFFELNLVKQPLQDQINNEYYDYKGVTHAHSHLSAGSGSPYDLIKAATEVGLDFLFLTEVNLSRRPLEWEGFHGRLMVLTGGEYSYSNSRIMAYDLSPEDPPQGYVQTQLYLNEKLSQKTLKQDSFFVVAHPLFSGFQWNGTAPAGALGLEILNLKKSFQKALSTSPFSAVLSALIYPVNPMMAMLTLNSNPHDEIALWDQWLKVGKYWGFLGTDATSKAIITENIVLKVPSYSALFGLASTHILTASEMTGDFPQDRKKLLDAIRNGQFYIGIDALGSTKGFVAEVLQGKKKYLSGSTVQLKSETDLRVKLPVKPNTSFEIQVIKDGQILLISNSSQAQLRLTSPGVYRVVVRLFAQYPFPFGGRWSPWIFSNPFFIVEK